MHDYDNYRYVTSNRIIPLTPKENEILKLLIENKGNLVKKEDFFEKAYIKRIHLKSLRISIFRLRQKLKDEITIKTRNCLGYYIP